MDQDWRIRAYVLFLKVCFVIAALLVLWLVVETVKAAVADQREAQAPGQAPQHAPMMS